MILRRAIRRLCRPQVRSSSTMVQLKPQVISAASLLGSDKQSETVAGGSPLKKVVQQKSSISKPKRILEVYAEFQHQHPDHFILLQVGDFFEVYGEDAIRASRILDIGLTSAPSKSTAGGEAVPMTGVPVRSVETYVERFIKAGHSVVLCEQFPSSKSTRMDRRITRIITPGTITEESLLDGGVNNFLLAIVPCETGYGLAWIDISTGFFRLASCPGEDVADELARINPREVLIPSGTPLDPLLARLKASVHPIKTDQVDGVKQIGDLYERIFSSPDEDTTDGFDHCQLAKFDKAELQASAHLLKYVLATQLDKRPYIEFPSVDDRRATMRIDAASFKSLEVLKSNSAELDSSLLNTTNHTLTAAGSRLLARWLQSPSTDLNVINLRHDSIEALLKHYEARESIRELLRPCKDLERCYQRLALNRSSGGPRDMQLILSTLKEITQIRKLLEQLSDDLSILKPIRLGLSNFDELIERLSIALNDKLPFRVSDGGVIREGYSPKLDSLRLCSGDVRRAKALLENKYRNETGKMTLRIDEGKILGFFLEVNRSEGPIDTANPLFHFDGQSETKFRYRTSELNSLRDSSSINEAKVLEEESLVWEELRRGLVRRGAEIVQAAKSIAELDVLCSMAQVAKHNNYVRPVIKDNSIAEFQVKDGRHPVVESIQSTIGRPFTRNDTSMSQSPFLLITGPNMGGKSTYLRQNALIAIMAQSGSFVPATSATLSLVDAVFTRIGASDDLARDRSTFMQEMAETAVILKHATARSLVIMDEIGRGTAAEEGFALALAIADHLISQVGCRTLFATHYYGLAKLAQAYPDRIQCLQTGAQNQSGSITFLHRLEPGVASHSFAIEIARLAGVPEAVLTRATDELTKLRSIIPL